MADHPSEQAQWHALKKILSRLPAQSIYYGTALGAIALAGGAHLPPELAFLAGSLGANTLTDLITRVARGDDLPDEAIRKQVEAAIAESGIVGLLSQEDFWRGYVQLIRRLDRITLLTDELRRSLGETATHDQVEKVLRILREREGPGWEKRRQIKVFISYARKDGFATATRLRQQLADLGFDIWQDVVSMNIGERWLPQIREAIEQVDVMVLVLTEGALHSNMVRQEWVHARRVGTPVLPVATYDIYKHPDTPRWVGHTDGFILNDADPAYEAKWDSFIEQLQNPRKPTPVLHMTEPLPETFVERVILQEKILDTLLHANRADPRPGVVTLHGEGGFGKTTLAQALTFNIDLVEAFTGGVLWATIGETGTRVLGELNALLTALQRGSVQFSDIDSARKALLNRVQGDDYLIVLDDVWNCTHAEPFLGIAGATYLITTRDGSVASLASETQRLHHVDELTSEEATAVLVKHLPEDVRPRLSAEERARLTELAQKLGEWPLLLEIFGGALREECLRGTSVAAALDYVEEGLREEGLDPFPGGSDSETRRRTLKGSMNASLRRFDDKERQRLYELSIFPEEIAVSEAVILKLWAHTGGLKGFRGRELVRRIAGHFSRFRAEREDEQPHIRFHDRIREYLGEQLGADGTRAAHAALLAAYNPEERPWWDIKYDGYLYEHLAYHLRGAGRADDLFHLLTDDCRWLDAKYRELVGDAGYVDDLTLALQDCEENTTDTVRRLAALWAARAVVNDRVGSYNDAMLRAMVLIDLHLEKDGRRTREALSHARLRPDNQQRFDGLLTVFQELDPASQQAVRMIEELTRAAQAIENGDKRTEALRALAAALALAEQHDAARETALAIEDSETRARALRDLAAALAQAGQHEAARETALAIEDSGKRAEALRDLAAALAIEWLAAALAQAGQHDAAREVFAAARETALAIEHDCWRARTLGDLAAALTRAGRYAGSEGAFATLGVRDSADYLQWLASPVQRRSSHWSRGWRWMSCARPHALSPGSGRHGRRFTSCCASER